MNNAAVAIFNTSRAEVIIKAEPSVVFAAWTELKERQKWEPTPEGAKFKAKKNKLAVGGVQVKTLNRDDKEIAEIETRFLELLANQRVIESIKVTQNGAVSQCRLSTFQMRAVDGGTLVHWAEQVTWLTGRDESEQHKQHQKAMLTFLADHCGGAMPHPAQQQQAQPAQAS